MENSVVLFKLVNQNKKLFHSVWVPQAVNPIRVLPCCTLCDVFIRIAVPDWNFVELNYKKKKREIQIASRPFSVHAEASTSNFSSCFN